MHLLLSNKRTQNLLNFLNLPVNSIIHHYRFLGYAFSIPRFNTRSIKATWRTSTPLQWHHSSAFHTVCYYIGRLSIEGNLSLLLENNSDTLRLCSRIRASSRSSSFLRYPRNRAFISLKPICRLVQSPFSTFVPPESFNSSVKKAFTLSKSFLYCSFSCSRASSLRFNSYN